jgi:hypothetical protein
MAFYPKYYYKNENQHLFDVYLNGLWFFLKLFLKGLLYLPHLVSAYLIATLLLDRGDSGLVWIPMILLLSYLIHLLFQLFKAFIITLKQRKNWLWLPLFLVAITYSCLFPTWMVRNASATYFQKLFGDQNELWFLVILLLFFTYFQTHFLRRFPVK